jgi:hypothetical protein
MRVIITHDVVCDIPNAEAGEVTIIPGGVLRMAGAGSLACASIFAYDGGAIAMHDADARISTPSILLRGATLLDWCAGTISLPADGDLTLEDGPLTIGDHELTSLITAPGTQATLELGVGARVSAKGGVMVMADGTIMGGGDVTSDVGNVGILLPQPTVHVEGDLTLGFDSLTRVQLRAGDQDAVHATGALTLGGSLDVTLSPGFVPTPGSSFEILKGLTVVPPFHRVRVPTLPSGSLHVMYQSDRVVIVCNP